MGIYARAPSGIPNGGFTTPSISPPAAPVAPNAPASYASKWMLPDQANGWQAGMTWNGSPITADQAAIFNRVAAEPTNQTWLAGTNGTANPMATAMQGMGVPTMNGGAFGYTTPTGATSPTPATSGSGLNGGVGTATIAGGAPTLGGIASGAGSSAIPGANMNIPAAAGNPYTLNIGSYLNPLMQYAMQQGTNSIMNSQASQGLLNSGDTLKQLYGYGLGLGANNFGTAANIAAGQQGFGAGLDQYDQQFAYNAQNNDRNFALQSLLGMGNLGLGGATQQAWNDRILSQLLSSNLGALGQAQGAGAIGGSNATNSAIQQLLQQYMQTNALNQMFPGGIGNP